MADIGRNSGSIAADELRAFIERVERMELEKKAISDDITEIYREAKATGFDVKVLRQIIRMRKQDHSERMEQEALLGVYMAALGMLPLFEGADDGADVTVVDEFDLDGNHLTVTVDKRIAEILGRDTPNA